jgi:hypothetical protein
LLKNTRMPHQNWLLLIALIFFAAVPCAQAMPARALWSRYVTGGVEQSRIYEGVIIFGLSHLDNSTTTQAFDARTGGYLWQRAGAVPLSGSSSYLAVGAVVERVDARTGRTIWRSAPLCGKIAIPAKNTDFQPPAVAFPTYTATIGTSLFVGCNGGKIFALHLSNGRVFASAYPTYLDNYDQIVSLGHDALGIGGEASGAYMYRQSAIVRSDSLSPIVVFGPGHRIIGARDGNAIVSDECCQGSHSDSWPANVELISIPSGGIISDVSLHPYSHPPSPDQDRPGPGILLAVGDDLYVATHSALFLYDLRNLRARPRTLYADLIDLPTVSDQRYLTIEEGTPGSVRSVAVLDADDDMQVIRRTNGSQPAYSSGSTRQLLTFSDGHIRPVDIDASCNVIASSESYAFTVCTNLHVPSRAQLGGPARFESLGPRTANPGLIAVYALGSSSK